MENKQSLRTIRVAVSHDNLNLRQILGRQLAHYGFDYKFSVNKIEDLLPHLQESYVDLMVCAIDDDTHHFANIIQAIRRRDVGSDPFPIIIAISSQVTSDTARVCINSGIDDLLVIPFSLQDLISRIQPFRKGRKPFVVTTEYIGPDRRDGPREGRGEARILTAPNPIAFRLEGRSEDEYRIQVMASAADLVQTAMAAYAAEILLIVQALEDSRFQIVRSEMARLAAGAYQIRQRVGVDHVRRLCDVMHALAGRLADGGVVSPRDLALLPQLGRAICLSLTDGAAAITAQGTVIASLLDGR